jgi:hypothetical protein
MEEGRRKPMKEGRAGNEGRSEGGHRRKQLKEATEGSH